MIFFKNTLCKKSLVYIEQSLGQSKTTSSSENSLGVTPVVLTKVKLAQLFPARIF